MKISVTVEGEPEELADGLERMGRAIRREFGEWRDYRATDVSETELDLVMTRKVWNRITPKAKSALTAMLEHPEGLTKEQIVEQVGGILADTRDLGGALSSISRVSKGIKVPNYQSAIYSRHEAPDGQILYQLSNAGRDHIKSILE